MVYDYVNTKPELNEETLAHYGIKGMKWHKSRLKSKTQELWAKTKRHIRGIDPETPTTYNGFTLGDNDGRRSSHSGRVKTPYQNPKDRQARLNAGIEAGRKRAKKKATIDKFNKRQLQKVFPSGGKNAGYGKEYVTSFRTKTAKSRKDPFGFGGDQYDAKYLRNPRAGSTRGQGYSSSIGSADNNKATNKSLAKKTAASRAKKNRKAK